MLVWAGETALGRQLFAGMLLTDRLGCMLLTAHTHLGRRPWRHQLSNVAVCTHMCCVCTMLRTVQAMPTWVVEHVRGVNDGTAKILEACAQLGGSAEALQRVTKVVQRIIQNVGARRPEPFTH